MPLNIFPSKLISRIIEKRRVKPLAESLPALEDWFDTDLGKSVLAEQQSILDEELSYMFGYHLVQLSISRRLKLFDNSRILHCFDVASIQADENSASAGLVGELDCLPLEDESVDVTILHHVLEYSANPHTVLKEAARVTIPKGYIIVFGFNPFSLMGLIKPFAQMLSQNRFWQRDSLRRSRVCDWLKLLECQDKRNWSGFYHLPINKRRYLQRFRRTSKLLQKWRVPFGSFYCIVAQKDLQCMTPIKPNWEKEGVGVAVPLPKRTATASSAARLALIKMPKQKKSDD